MTIHDDDDDDDEDGLTNISQVNIQLCLEPPILARNVRALALLRLAFTALSF